MDNLKQQRALDGALESVRFVQAHDPVAPALSIDDEIACRGCAADRSIAGDYYAVRVA